jgi:adenylate cyclase
MWPRERTETLAWLATGTSADRFIDDIFVEMCARLRRSGIPVARAMMYLDSNHPQWLGAGIQWKLGVSEAEIEYFKYGSRQTARYLDSPVHEIRSGAVRLRRRLTDPAGEGAWYPIYGELRAIGMTDYVAWPLLHTLGKRHTVTFASDGVSGFSQADLDAIEDLLPLLALVSEIRLKNRVTRTILETYVGPHASEAILAGATTRGSGTTVNAAILICDLRGFTALSDLWPRDDVIELLNGYFDAIAAPIEKFGGEILKFMGDGLLAIFPMRDDGACHNLLAAVREARSNMITFNATQRGDPVGYGIGIHIGDVMYGNIGSKSRLDFTVIGPAVNIASRLEGLSKQMGRQVLLSGEFVSRAECAASVDRMGMFDLKGVTRPVEVFALHDD